MDGRSLHNPNPDPNLQWRICAAERAFLGAQLQDATERHAQAADTIALLRSQLLQVMKAYRFLPHH